MLEVSRGKETFALAIFELTLSGLARFCHQLERRPSSGFVQRHDGNAKRT